MVRAHDQAAWRGANIRIFPRGATFLDGAAKSPEENLLGVRVHGDVGRHDRLRNFPAALARNRYEREPIRDLETVGGGGGGGVDYRMAKIKTL